MTVPVGGSAEAYSSWRPETVHVQDPLVNMLAMIGMVLSVAFIILFSFERGRPLRRLIAILLALTHMSYLVSYADAYDMSLRILPLLDVLSDGKHTSLVLDVAQLMLVYLTISYLAERKRRNRKA